MQTSQNRSHCPSPLPRVPASLLLALLPVAEREEVAADLAEEFAARAAARGALRARGWLWWQVLGSVPALLGRTGWRGWSGFEPRASRLRPGGPPMESVVMDLRYVARRLWARPTYALLATLTLALGVGGTAAVWGLVRGLLIQPLPYAHEEQLDVFWSPGDWSEAELLHLLPDVPGFQGVAGFRGEDVTLRQGDAPAQLLSGISTSAPLFDVLGVRPLMGRGLQPGDDREGAEPVAVLSYGLWQELGGSPQLVGSRLMLDGVMRTVVGVMPRGFWFPDPTVRVWLAEPLDASDRSGNYALVGRRAPGLTQAATDVSLRAIAARLKERFQYPAQWDKTRAPALTPLREHVLGGLRVPLLATLAAMAVILLIACGNVAALMLGQVDARATELAVRAALGADRRRMTQQLLAEALLVGLAAAAFGALFAAQGFRVLAGALPLGALAEAATLDWSLFWAALVVAVLAALAVAMVPAAALWRSDPQRALSRARTGGGRGGRTEGGLVVVQVALAVLLTAGAALLVRSVMNLRAIDPGVDTERVAVVDVALPADLTRAQKRQTLRELVAALEALPGVSAAGSTWKLPLRGPGQDWGVEVEGRPDLPSTSTYFRLVSPGYFRAMGISLREGRLLERTDTEESERVVVVNQAFARKYFPGESAVGKRIGTGFPGFGGFERIVGVVEDVAEARLTDGPVPARYMLYEQVPSMWDMNALVLRVEGREPGSVLDEARRAVQQVAPSVAVQRTTTLADVFTLAVGPVRQVMSVLTLLTGLALVLGAVGIYGVTSQHVSRRRRELGIRLALGLTPGRVVAQVVGRGGALVLLGSAVGTVAVLLLARLLSSLLYGVSAVDPLALLGATALLLLVGVVAALVPARRASRLDPAAVFREQ